MLDIACCRHSSRHHLQVAAIISSHSKNVCLPACTNGIHYRPFNPPSHDALSLQTHHSSAVPQPHQIHPLWLPPSKPSNHDASSHREEPSVRGSRMHRQQLFRQTAKRRSCFAARDALHSGRVHGPPLSALCFFFFRQDARPNVFL